MPRRKQTHHDPDAERLEFTRYAVRCMVRMLGTGLDPWTVDAMSDDELRKLVTPYLKSDEEANRDRALDILRWLDRIDGGER